MCGPVRRGAWGVRQVAVWKDSQAVGTVLSYTGLVSKGSLEGPAVGLGSTSAQRRRMHRNRLASWDR